MNNIQRLHEKALFTAKEYLRFEAELIDVLQEVDRTKAYLHFEMPSLFAYSTKLLKLSDHVALTLIGIARKSVQIPELKTTIKENKITVSNARRIVPVLNLENKSEWIEKAAILSQNKLELELAKSFPQQVSSPTKIKYKTESKVRFEVDLETCVIDRLRRAQEILSQKKKLHVDEAEALDFVLDEFIQRHDPIEKAKRAEKKTVEKPEASQKAEEVAIDHKPITDKNTSTSLVLRRVSLTAKLKHELALRDQNQCAHIYPDGSKCKTRKWLHIHHIKEISQGGTNDPVNLLTLCSAHHRLLHYQRERGVV